MIINNTGAKESGCFSYPNSYLLPVHKYKRIALLIILTWGICFEKIFECVVDEKYFDLSAFLITM